MPTIAIKYHSIVEAEEPAIVIPLGIQGKLSAEFDDFRNRLISSAMVLQLGEIAVDHDTEGLSGHPVVIFVCSEDDITRNYAAVWKVGHALAEYASQSGLKAIALPVLGTDIGDLSPAECIVLLASIFSEKSGDTNLVFYTKNQQVTQEAVQKFMTDAPANVIALKASIRMARVNSWVKELLNDHEFYFELARQKYQEFREFVLPDINVVPQLFKALDQNWPGSFLKFLDQFDPQNVDHKLLLICGELISYIDQRGANKNVWNKNPDKRTIARAGVRQKDWVYNLLRLKFTPEAKASMPESIQNAILYLELPQNRLTMLSYRHRSALCRNILGKSYGDESDLVEIFQLFTDADLYPVNEQNFGALCSRILYLPENKMLWLLENLSEDEEEEQLPEGASIEEARLRYSGKTVAPTIHSDIFASIDLLDYDLYAEAITAFIKHKDSHPPLSIGILAPWGKGKTTLMRFIQTKLKGGSTPSVGDVPPVQPPVKDRFFKRNWGRLFGYLKWNGPNNETQSNYGILYSWLSNKKDQVIQMKQLEYPTIWFNAWKFQKTEQLWAGFAYEIIRQLVEQIPNPLEKEKFWLRLNLKRVDREKLKRDIIFKSINKFLPGTILLLLCAISGILLWMANPGLYLLGFSAPLLIALSLLKKGLENFKRMKPDIDIAKYVKQPEYAVKRGLLHEIEDDLKEVMNLLVSDKAPAVIFVDDLDRCSPPVVTEVVEAINLFISGDLPRCYFILGQDAQMVAASLDVAYEKIGEKAINIRNEKGSLGWYFMEKFMQLQFNIPVLSPEKCKSFLSSLLNAGQATQVSEKERAEILTKTAEFRQKLAATDDVTGVLNAQYQEIGKNLDRVDPKQANELKGQIIQKAATTFDDNDPEILDLVENVSTYLGDSPRAIKRFVNLYRFYKFLQYTRFRFDSDELGDTHLSQWIVIMIRWPQLVRAVQWDTEDFFQGQSPHERAEKFEALLNNYKRVEDWKSFISGSGNQLKWLEDDDLFNFMGVCREEKNSIANAIIAGVW